MGVAILKKPNEHKTTKRHNHRADIKFTTQTIQGKIKITKKQQQKKEENIQIIKKIATITTNSPQLHKVPVENLANL